MKTEYLLQREVDGVLATLMPDNALVMRVALHTGLRVGDVLALKTEQLKPRFWVTESKTGKRRQVGLPEPLLSDLKKTAGDLWVFPGKDPKNHRTRQAVWKDVKRAAKALRLPQNVAPHSARKVYAVDLLQKYGDIDRVRRALNHGSESVTLIYALADKQLESKTRRRRAAPGRRKV
jgi:integrase